MGLDPKRPRPLVFRHDEKKLAAVVIARGDEGGPLTVRLQPAATITGRLRDDDGTPRRGVRINVNYAKGQFGPGYYFPFLNASLAGDGRFRIDGLIPGVAYDLGVRTDNALLGDFADRRQARPGETRDLGDVKVKTAAVILVRICDLVSGSLMLRVVISDAARAVPTRTARHRSAARTGRSRGCRRRRRP